MSVTAEEYARFRAQGGVFDFSARAKVALTGADRVRYLNGQVTADVKKLRPVQALPACLTTAKGKLNAQVMITVLGETLVLDTDAELRDTLAARLERYIIADDVTLEDRTEELALWHLVGREPGELGVRLGVTAVSANRLGRAGWDFWLPSPAPSLGEAFLSKELAETLRIEAGLPRWGHELGEETLPPEANLDRTHIDYHKGCYIGQETISRIKSVGHVNRQLFGFVSESGQMLPLGGEMFAAEAPEKVLGTLTSAAWSFALAKPIALGYLKRGSPAQLLVRAVGSADQPPLAITRCDLPSTAPS